jgi:hypothetical protein
VSNQFLGYWATADIRNEASGIKPLSGPTKPRKHLIDPDLPAIYRSKGFVDDLKTGRWMLIPGTPLFNQMNLANI